MRLRSITAGVTLSVVFAMGCGGSSKTPAASCTSMCTDTGFTSGTVDVQSNETNCFCTGSGTVTAAACTKMCSDAGKGTGTTFTSGMGVTNANACQCQ